MSVGMDPRELEALLNQGKVIAPAGQLQIIPPLVVEFSDGQKRIVPQVSVMLISDEMISRIAAHVAVHTSKLVIQDLEERGLIAKREVEPEPPRELVPLETIGETQNEDPVGP